MAKVKKKLTVGQKRAKKEEKAERQNKYMWVFMNGKQVRVERPRTIEGIPEDEWIAENADPIWLHQNEMWDVLHERESREESEGENIF